MSDLQTFSLLSRSSEFKYGVLLSAWDCVIGPKSYLAWTSPSSEEVPAHWLDAANMLLNSELCVNRPLGRFLKHKVLFSDMHSYLCIYFSAQWKKQERNCALILCITSPDEDNNAEAVIGDMQSPLLAALCDASMELSQLINQLPCGLGLLGKWGIQKLSPILDMMLALLEWRKTKADTSKQLDMIDEKFMRNKAGFLMTSLTAHLQADGFSVVIGKSKEDIEKHIAFLSLLAEDPVEPQWRTDVVDHQSKLVPWIRIQGFLSGTQDYSCALGRQPVHVWGWRQCLAIHDLNRRLVYFSHKDSGIGNKTKTEMFEENENDENSAMVVFKITYPGQLRLPVRFDDQAKMIQVLVTQMTYADRTEKSRLLKWFRLKFQHLVIAVSSFIKDMAIEDPELAIETAKMSVRELSKVFDMDEKGIRILLPAALKRCYGIKIAIADNSTFKS